MSKVMKITKSTNRVSATIATAITGTGSFLTFSRNKGKAFLNRTALADIGMEEGGRIDIYVEDGKIMIEKAKSPASGFSLASNGNFYSIGLYNMAKSMLGECPCEQRFYSSEGESGFSPSNAIDRKEARRQSKPRKSRMKSFSAKVIAKNIIRERQIIKALNEASARKKLEAKWGNDVNITSLKLLAGRKPKAV